MLSFAKLTLQQLKIFVFETFQFKIKLRKSEPEMNKYEMILILFLPLCENLIDCYSFEVKTITLNRHSGCPQDEKNIMHFNGNFKNIARNKYTVNGEITIKEKIIGPIEVRTFNILFDSLLRV